MTRKLMMMLVATKARPPIRGSRYPGIEKRVQETLIVKGSIGTDKREERMKR